MFVLRSAFWLTLAFLLVAPHGTDFGAAATSLKDQTVEAGQDLIASQIVAAEQRLPDLLVSAVRTSLETTYVSRPSLETTFLAATTAVRPRPRPAALS